MKQFLIIFVSLIVLSISAHAETVKISADISLSFTIPQGWQWAKDPPQKLLEEMAEHIGHEAAEKGYTPGKEQMLAAARKRLTANEVLLVNPESLANVSIDFSRLRQGEKAPSKKTILLSAKYAGQSLEQEEGVSQLQGKNKPTEVAGAWYAYRYDADFLQHENKQRFSGIIGFVSPYWFFFYATNPMRDTEDGEKIEQIFQSLRIGKN